MKKTSLQLLGWGGALMIVLAYVLVSFSVITSTSLEYQLLNLFGAFGIIIETYSKKDFPPMVLNLVWIAIAFVAIISLII